MRDAPQPKPVRIRYADALGVLQVSRPTLDRLVRRDLFTVIAPGGRGRGKRIYLLPDELEVYGTRGEDALRAYRAEMGRATKRRRK